MEVEGEEAWHGMLAVLRMRLSRVHEIKAHFLRVEDEKTHYGLATTMYMADEFKFSDHIEIVGIDLYREILPLLIRK